MPFLWRALQFLGSTLGPVIFGNSQVGVVSILWGPTAECRQYLHALGPKVSIIYILASLGLYIYIYRYIYIYNMHIAYLGLFGPPGLGALWGSIYRTYWSRSASTKWVHLGNLNHFSSIFTLESIPPVSLVVRSFVHLHSFTVRSSCRLTSLSS